MFEVIISNVNTGRVERKTFDTREDASRYADRRIRTGWREPRNHRVEIHHREPPTVHTVRPAASVTAAA